MKEFSTEQLRNELAERGFQTQSLSHIDEVQQNYDCSDEDAMDVLREVFNSDYVRECIFDIIDEVCNKYKIEKKKS